MKLLLIGGGGHCHSVLDTIFSLNLYDEVAIIDNIKSTYRGVPVIGQDENLPGLFKTGWTAAFITVGSVGNTGTRRRLYEMIKTIGFTSPVIIDPEAVVAGNVCIGDGTFVGKRAVVNTGTSIGICSIINTGSIIEHDCSIGEFSHISPGAVLCGEVSVGRDTHIGAASVVRQQITIGKETLIGAGSVVVNNISDGKKAYGNPCKVVNE